MTELNWMVVVYSVSHVQLLQPHGLYSAKLLFPGKDTGKDTFPCPGHLPYPGIEPRSPALQADSLPTELQGP